jgi:GrpB-like predicted nucleotidyltransferase (UPF0157 family)
MEFEALRAVYEVALGRRILRVEHVGSTAVPDLEAKPILDIDLVIEDDAVFSAVVAGLASLGYRHVGDQGIPQREAFKPADPAVPVVSPPRAWMRHHLYVCPAYSRELARHVAFRDALRERAGWRREYEALKRGIAARSGDDRKVYARIKERECRAFVEGVLDEWAKACGRRT